MKKILFLIHDLGPGGAEKVLVNLVNHMDREKFDITVMTLFDVGVNRQYLAKHIHYRSCFKKMIRGNSHLMKLLSPRQLHRWLIKDRYDIEVAYLEGPSSRIISGCPHPDTRLYGWVHCLPTRQNVTLGYRSYGEAEACYRRLDRVVCVSETAAAGFRQVFPTLPTPVVLYNTNDSEKIRTLSAEGVDLPEAKLRLVAAGRLTPVKAFDRLIRIHARLRDDGLPVQTLILGTGALEPQLKAQAARLGVSDSLLFTGYQTNPYQFIAKSDVFVCSSLSEGFSTAATEALIVGTPVCTVEVSGMKEMLGSNDEYGIVTANNEDALYEGLKRLLSDPKLLAQYKEKAARRGLCFDTKTTVSAVERMLLEG